MEDRVIYGDKLKSMIREMLAQYNRKNHDYGNSFEESLNEDGLIAAKVRIGDKIRRFHTLMNKHSKVLDESILDTLKDLATYCEMAIMWNTKEKDIHYLFNQLADYAAVTYSSDDSFNYYLYSMEYNYRWIGQYIKNGDENQVINNYFFRLAKLAVCVAYKLSVDAIVPKKKEKPEKYVHVDVRELSDALFKRLVEKLVLK